MKKYLSLSLFFTYALFSCGGDEQKPKADSEAPRYEVLIPPPDSVHEEHGMPEVINECYRFDQGDEHKSIEITIVLDSVWGNFRWGIDGKDGVKGEFTGNFHGDTLWIIYQAVMEGHLVPREVAFLRKGDKLYEAQGTQKEGPKGVYFYPYKKKLEYSDPEPMVKGPCM